MWFKKSFHTLFLLLMALSALYLWTPVEGANEKFHAKIKKLQQNRELVERERQYLLKKARETRMRESIAAKKYSESRHIYDKTLIKLKDLNYNLYSAKRRLDVVSNELYDIEMEQDKLESFAKKRLKDIYKGEKFYILEVLLDIRSVTSFIDKLYYKELMVKKDKALLDKLAKRTERLMENRMLLNHEKNKIAGLVNRVQDESKKLELLTNSNASLMEDLKTKRIAYERAQRRLESEASQLTGTIQSLIRLEIQQGQRYVYKRKNSGLSFMTPIIGILTSPYGPRVHPIFRSRSMHTGIDISAQYGTPIKVAESGKVIHVGWYGGYGKVVIVNHGDLHGRNYTTLYAHLSSYAVSKGQQVQKGQVIAYEGTTGYSTGPHLHFEVRLNGRHTNPLMFLR